MVVRGCRCAGTNAKRSENWRILYASCKLDRAPWARNGDLLPAKTSEVCCTQCKVYWRTNAQYVSDLPRRADCRSLP